MNSKSTGKEAELNTFPDNWNKDDGFKAWVESEPKLGEVDLRPYFFACKEREDYFFNQVHSDKLRELVSKLMGNKMIVASVMQQIKELSKEESKAVFVILENKIKKSPDFTKSPAGIDGIRALVSHHPDLEKGCISLITSFDTKKVGAWICKGWDQCLKSDSSKKELHNYFLKLQEDGTSFTKNAVQNLLK
jgi:DNA-binding NarL/FixJ family response regulator